MKDALVILPVIVPLLTATAALFSWRSRRLQRWMGMAGSGVFLLAAIALLVRVRHGSILVVEIGGWEAPFGIVLVADVFAAIMILTTALIGLAISIYGAGEIDCRREIFGFHPLIHLLLAGCAGALLTGDLFNLYVWMEVILISSLVLMTLGGRRSQLHGAVAYFLFNFLASSLFLAAVALAYALSGTLNMAQLAVVLPELLRDAPGNVLPILFLVSLGTKAALFPLFFWLPASYPTPPPVIAALFGGLVTKIFVCVIFRVFLTVFASETDFIQQVLLPISGLTMFIGVLGAFAHTEMRKILSFHVVSQIGYMIFGLALMTITGLAGAIYFIVHNIMVKTSLFLAAGIVHALRGTMDVTRIGGLSRQQPMLSGAFFISAISLAGMPPLSGFFGKLALIEAGLAAGEGLLIAVALITGILTLLSMMKIWTNAFWSPADQGEDSHVESIPGFRLFPMRVALYALAGITVFMGLGAGPVFELMILAAEQLLAPEMYIGAVLE